MGWLLGDESTLVLYQVLDLTAVMGCEGRSDEQIQKRSEHFHGWWTWTDSQEQILGYSVHSGSENISFWRLYSTYLQLKILCLFLHHRNIISDSKFTALSSLQHFCPISQNGHNKSAFTSYNHSPRAGTHLALAAYWDIYLCVVMQLTFILADKYVTSEAKWIYSLRRAMSAF